MRALLSVPVNHLNLWRQQKFVHYTLQHVEKTCLEHKQLYLQNVRLKPTSATVLITASPIVLMTV